MFPLNAKAVPCNEVVAQGIALLVAARQPGASSIGVTGMKSLSGGNSRLAWAFDVSWTDEAGCHEQECVLLGRLGAGQLEVDMLREFETLSALHPCGLPVPQALWIDEDGSLLGMPGFVMTRGQGNAGLRELLKPSSSVTRPLVEELMRIAARLHSLDWTTLTPSLGSIEQAHEAPRDVLHQWERQFRMYRMEPLPALSSVFGWLHRNLPAKSHIAVVHGDMRVGNFLYENGKITMLLDWEISHLGDPMEDLAWAYRHLWGPHKFLPIEDAIAIYEQAGGCKVDPRRLAWYRIFSEAKFAVISLTAAHSFLHGKTSNLRMSGRASKVNECLRMAFEWIEEQETAK